jgi:hypothetical protein
LGGPAPRCRCDLGQVAPECAIDAPSKQLEKDNPAPAASGFLRGKDRADAQPAREAPVHQAARFPALAKCETRTIKVFGKNSWGLPKADYTLVELYCNDGGCDCRRVFFDVLASLRMGLEAVVTHGREKPAIYAGWLRDEDLHMVAELVGPSLNLGSPRSALAPGILKCIDTEWSC